MKKVILPLVSTLMLAIPSLAFANTVQTEVSVESAGFGIGLALLGVALATALPCIGSAMGVSGVGQAGSGLLTEKPEMAGKVITLAVLPGSQGLYGMVISLLFLFSYGLPLMEGKLMLSAGQGIAIFAACLPVAIAGMTSAPLQGKVCAAGMHMLARDSSMTGRVITLAALVETYALLGFLISFFMLSNISILKLI